MQIFIQGGAYGRSARVEHGGFLTHIRRNLSVVQSFAFNQANMIRAQLAILLSLLMGTGINHISL